MGRVAKVIFYLVTTTFTRDTDAGVATRPAIGYTLLAIMQYIQGE